MGGGLSGLTLALHLRQSLPEASIMVLERHRHPVPHAIHKVGESSVEIAADYFAKVLGLEEHLRKDQLKKFGFRFFFSDGREDIDQVLELGASRFLSAPSYQIDRGIFENHLGVIARERGIEFLDGSAIRDFDLGEDGAAHQVRFERDGQHSVTARWLVDACGRAGLIKRRLGLGRDNGHHATAVWFRVGARIDVNDWSTCEDWLDRCAPRSRWLSTNHLVGEGYWVWLIPLASGSHSVGIVADARLHPTETLNSFDKAMAWLHRRQPRLARDLEGKRAQLQDFRWLKDVSYGCTRVFDGRRRWALTGESGAFLDPFYSPGSDFIAIANTYICSLIARDHRGETAERLARIYERYYLSFYESTLLLYRDQYGLFGDPEVLPVKVMWDYTYYWGILCQLFFQRRLTDVSALSRVSDVLGTTRALNEAIQHLLREWSRRGGREHRPGLIDQAAMPWFAELNRGLTDTLDADQFIERMRTSGQLLNALAREIVDLARARQPDIATAAVERLLSGDSCTAGLLEGVHWRASSRVSERVPARS